MIGNGLGFVAGVAACIVWRWMQWIKAQPQGIPMSNFWRDRLATNVSSVVVALLLMGAYLSGGLHAAVVALAPAEWEGKIQPLYDKLWAAAPAGFLITFGARKIVGRLQDKIGEKDED